MKRLMEALYDYDRDILWETFCSQLNNSAYVVCERIHSAYVRDYKDAIEGCIQASLLRGSN